MSKHDDNTVIAEQLASIECKLDYMIKKIQSFNISKDQKTCTTMQRASVPCQMDSFNQNHRR